MLIGYNKNFITIDIDFVVPHDTSCFVLEVP